MATSSPVSSAASVSASAPAPLVVGHAAQIAKPLATWLIRSGVGHREFANALKLVFLEAAQEELEQRGHAGQSDTALSLLSGLHRKDVKALLPQVLIPVPDEEGALERGRPGPVSQVVTRWLTLFDGKPLARSGADSFDALVAQVSSDIRPKALLAELERLGVAESFEDTVRLTSQAFTPNPKLNEAAQLVAGSVSDHLQAAVQNLGGPSGKTYLEQSVFADGLSADGIAQLEQLANSLWQHVLKTTVKAAVPLCERDEPKGGDRRVRIGMYCYSAPMNPQAHAASGDAQ